MKTKVLQLLRPKTVALGFSLTELEGVATTLVGNLTEDATDEAISAEIEKALPFLKMSQSMATRVINDAKSKKPATEPKGAEIQKEETDDEPAWSKRNREVLEQRLAAIENRSASVSRRGVFEAKLTGLLPKQKEAKLKDFDRISFKDEDDFNSYLTEQEAVLSDIQQELADKGLEILGQPASGGIKPNKQEASKEEISAILGQMDV